MFVRVLSCPSVSHFRHEIQSKKNLETLELQKESEHKAFEVCVSTYALVPIYPVHKGPSLLPDVIDTFGFMTGLYRGPRRRRGRRTMR